MYREYIHTHTHTISLLSTGLSCILCFLFLFIDYGIILILTYILLTNDYFFILLWSLRAKDIHTSVLEQPRGDNKHPESWTRWSQWLVLPHGARAAAHSCLYINLTHKDAHSTPARLAFARFVALVSRERKRERERERESDKEGESNRRVEGWNTSEGHWDAFSARSYFLWTSCGDYYWLFQGALRTRYKGNPVCHWEWETCCTKARADNHEEIFYKVHD